MDHFYPFHSFHSKKKLANKKPIKKSSKIPAAGETVRCTCIFFIVFQVIETGNQVVGPRGREKAFQHFWLQPTTRIGKWPTSLHCELLMPVCAQTSPISLLTCDILLKVKVCHDFRMLYRQCVASHVFFLQKTNCSFVACSISFKICWAICPVRTYRNFNLAYWNEGTIRPQIRPWCQQLWCRLPVTRHRGMCLNSFATHLKYMILYINKQKNNGKIESPMAMNMLASWVEVDFLKYHSSKSSLEPYTSYLNSEFPPHGDFQDWHQIMCDHRHFISQWGVKHAHFFMSWCSPCFSRIFSETAHRNNWSFRKRRLYQLKTGTARDRRLFSKDTATHQRWVEQILRVFFYPLDNSANPASCFTW